ncbi:MAG TPA: BamA/TamA family outer membrane protein [Puia sp.]|nr:BamA/TamA family outer membrane protein [Puia sp.]
MSKLRLYSCIFLLIANFAANAQHQLKIVAVDKDSFFLSNAIDLQISFKSKNACLDYIAGLPSLLAAKGFATASVDSIYSDSAITRVQVYVGNFFKWGFIKTNERDASTLEASGWNNKNFSGRPFNYQQLESSQQRVLNYMENNGYPFAKIFIDSISIVNNELSGMLKIDKGPLYKIDSIRVFGNAKISTDFLKRYLNIPDGTIYKKEKLETISKRLLELPYVVEQQPWKLTLLGEGSVLDLYLKPKKSSQIDALVGFLPSANTNGVTTSSKLLITGQATVNLKNALGNGESIGLNWQQVQPKSPKLDLAFAQPYLFNSPFGISTSFSLYKRDSSYININFLIGAQYSTSSTQTSTVFLQTITSNLLNVDSAGIISSHKLPAEADYNSISLGLNYEFNNTNYRFNPRRGNELQFTGTIGTKKIKKNNKILKFVDPTDSSFSFNSLYDSVKLNSYQMRLRLAAAHYFQLGKATTLKLGINGGLFHSPTHFLNELFLIGGYRLLRGFDEESIYASQYAVGTLEYRYLIGLNSFLFSFVDAGWAKNNIPSYNFNNNYLGVGLGLAFETKAGIFNISYAIGKQDNNSFSFRAAKIHLGYVNFF